MAATPPMLHCSLPPMKHALSPGQRSLSTAACQCGAIKHQHIASRAPSLHHSYAVALIERTHSGVLYSKAEFIARRSCAGLSSSRLGSTTNLFPRQRLAEEDQEGANYCALRRQNSVARLPSTTADSSMWDRLATSVHNLYPSYHTAPKQTRWWALLQIWPRARNDSARRRADESDDHSTRATMIYINGMPAGHDSFSKISSMGSAA